MAVRTLLLAVAGLLMLPTTSTNSELPFCTRNPGTCRAPNELAAEIAMKARSAIQIFQKATNIVAVIIADGEETSALQRTHLQDTLSRSDREPVWFTPKNSQRGG